MTYHPVQGNEAWALTRSQAQRLLASKAWQNNPTFVPNPRSLDPPAGFPRYLLIYGTDFGLKFPGDLSWA